MGASKIPKGRAFFAWQIRFFSRCGRLSGCPVRPAGFICIEVTGPIQTNVTINYHQLYA